MSADLKSRAAAREQMTGTFLNLGSILSAEACALAGFDWLLIDLEHGGGTEQQLAGQLLAGEAHGVKSIVRVESAEPIRTGRALDMGAAGVMFPRLRTLADVQSAVSSIRYPPLGARGVASYNRAGKFGLGASSLEHVASRSVCVIQVETVELITILDEAAAVDGVDVLFVGPRDLQTSITAAGGAAADFDIALDRVLAAATATGVAAGIIASSESELADYCDRGFTFNAFASDSAMLAGTGRDVLQRLANRRASAEVAGAQPNTAKTRTIT